MWLNNILENFADLQFHELCEFKDNSDIFRLRLGPQNPTSKKHLSDLINITESNLTILETLHSTATDDLKLLQLEYQIAALNFDLSKYYLDQLTIGDSLSDE